MEIQGRCIELARKGYVRQKKLVVWVLKKLKS